MSYDNIYLHKSMSKKPSLFKQRIKEARQKQQLVLAEPENQYQSFPHALKIDTREETTPIQTQTPLQTQTADSNFVKNLLMSAMKQEQVQQIEAQNWRSVCNMSAEQLQKYRQMIMSEMPPSFIRKIRKIKQVGVQKQQGSEKQQDEMSEMEEQLKQTKRENSLSNFIFNITTNTISYLHSPSQMLAENQLTFPSIKLMLESENNQTQIVACRFLPLIAQQLAASLVDPQYPLVQVSGAYFHYTILLTDFYNNQVKSVMYQMKRTKFKSCWTQMMMACLEWIGNINRAHLPESISEQLIAFLKMMRQKQWVKIENSVSAQGISDALLLLSTSPSPSMPSHNIAHAIEVIFLEQLEQAQEKPLNFEPYLLKLQRVATQSQMVEFAYQASIQISERYARRNNISDPQLQLAQDALYRWSKQPLSIKSFSDYASKQQLSGEQQHFFKCLFITKSLNYQAYVAYLSNTSSASTVQVANEFVANIITMLNIENSFTKKVDYSKPELTQQIHNIESMIEFLMDCFGQINHTNNGFTSSLIGISHLLFVNMLTIFDETASLVFSYQSFEQQALDKLFRGLSEVLSIFGRVEKMWAILPVEKIKMMIRSYNYSSFGNYCFTRVLYFLMKTCPEKRQEIEELILEEVVLRYPFLFYYAAENNEPYGNVKHEPYGNVTVKHEPYGNVKHEPYGTVKHEPYGNVTVKHEPYGNVKQQKTNSSAVETLKQKALKIFTVDGKNEKTDNYFIKYLIE